MSQFQRKFGILVAIAVLVAGWACSLGGYTINFSDPTETPQPSANVQQPTAAQMATLAPTKAGAIQPTTAAQATQAPQANGLPDLSNLGSSFSSLDSYKMVFVMNVTGKDSKGQDTKQNLNLLQEILRSKDSMHMSMSGAGFSTELTGGSIDLYQIGKAGYMLMGEKDKQTCLSYSADTPTFDTNQLLTPDEMINSIKVKSLVAKGETVNGVKADHFTVEQSSLGFGTATSQSGDVWIAQQGGYMVKFTGTATGDFTIISETVKGTVTWTYDLTDANKLKEIALPVQCKDAAGAVSDLPIPPNATEQGNLGDLITFSSPDATKTVADFFRNNLPAKGWKIVSDSNLDTVVMMTIQKDTRKYSIMIAPGKDNKGSSVLITKAQ